MANEIRVNSGLQLRRVATGGTILNQYNAQPSGFRASMDGVKGPTPGAVTALTTGTQIDFSELTQPTFCQITNLGRADLVTPTASDYFEYGIWDPGTSKFYPLGEVGPGETYCIKFSRNLQEIYAGPGSGTAAGGETARLMLLGHGTDILARVDAFER